MATGALLPWVLLAGFAVAAEPDEEVGSTYARVRFVEDVLNVERPSEGAALAAELNAPLVPGDRIWTGAGRAEIELADSSVIVLDADTRLELRNLADYDNRYERTNLLALRHGAIRIDNRDGGDADSVFQIDTEAGSIYLLSGGSIRIEADAGETTVSSYSGVAEFSGDGGSVLVRSGQRASVVIGAVPDEPRRFNTGRSDAFDRFHDERIAAYLDDGSAAVEVEQVPVEVRPYVRELSFYGTWTTMAPYGTVWRPAFGSGWSPYVHGSWAWYPTGWVWVSYDPWGWAPYRYGRWDYAAPVGWFWVPGRVWSGAWVSFAVSSGYVGWCPLNYWNRPVFHDAWIATQPTVQVARLDPRGWQFVPVGRFGRGAVAAASRTDHLPRGTEVVVTRRLPAPPQQRVISTPRTEPLPSLVDQVRRSRVALPATSTSSGDPVPFRVQEQRRAAAPAAPRRAAGSPAAPKRAAATPAAPKQAAPTPAAPKDAPSRGRAVAPRSPGEAIPLPQATAHAPRVKGPGRPADVTASRVPVNALPSSPPIPSRPQRNEARQERNQERNEATHIEPPPHDPAVGRLVGGARKAPAPPAPAAATAAAATTTPAPAPQGARPPASSPRVAAPPSRPAPAHQPPKAGGLPTDAERRQNESKPNGKPAKPKAPESEPHDPSGSD